jgi:hypothetical protein
MAKLVAFYVCPVMQLTGVLCEGVLKAGVPTCVRADAMAKAA